MDIWIQFIVLVIASYTVGSIPLSYFVARARGVDLRKQGTQQVGGGNLWRTTSRKLGLLVGIFDLIKGAVMVLIARQVGLDAGLQLGVGLAAIAGHNWPAFLRFHGGRGIATTLGIIIILPWINRAEITTWPLVAFFSVAVALVIVFRRTPVPILAGLIMLPVMSAINLEPLSVILGYTAMALIIIAKRLIAQPSTEKREIGIGHLLLNRLLFDRDVRYRADWVHRKHSDKKE
ncbi:MAG: glycerol-3-phosphate acyltransferase [Dehalococcoidales bacterium]|nr:glycerol-3-phosphate acyltransferase [Dehalococcoidales bacterium]